MLRLSVLNKSNIKSLFRLNHKLIARPFLIPQLKNVKEEAPISIGTYSAYIIIIITILYVYVYLYYIETGNHILYRGRHERSILVMLGVSFFNFIYWSYQMTIHYM